MIQERQKAEIISSNTLDIEITISGEGKFPDCQRTLRDEIKAYKEQKETTLYARRVFEGLIHEVAGTSNHWGALEQVLEDVVQEFGDKEDDRNHAKNFLGSILLMQKTHIELGAALVSAMNGDYSGLSRMSTVTIELSRAASGIPGVIQINNKKLSDS